MRFWRWSRYRGLRELTVGNEDDGLGFRTVFGLRDVGVESSDGFDLACWCPFLDFARHAAGADSNTGGHLVKRCTMLSVDTS